MHPLGCLTEKDPLPENVVDRLVHALEPEATLKERILQSGSTDPVVCLCKILVDCSVTLPLYNWANICMAVGKAFGLELEYLEAAQLTDYLESNDCITTN